MRSWKGDFVVVSAKEYYVTRFLTLDEQARLIFKSNKIGYELSFQEYGAGTVLTFTKKGANA